MTRKHSEAKARLIIDELLRNAGWRLLDSDFGNANVIVEDRVSFKRYDINELGENYEKTKHGFIDYLLLDKNGNPLVVLEAKSTEKNPALAEPQAREYAQGKDCKFIILSNGNYHKLLNLETDEMETLSKMPTEDELILDVTYEDLLPEKRKKLLDFRIDEFMIAESQDDTISKLLTNDKEKNTKLCLDKDLIVLRNYQLDAVMAMRKAVEENKERFLFEMATGTGKTLVAASIMKWFLNSGAAKRILFLVDRVDLEEQGIDDFNEYFDNDGNFNIGKYKENRVDWQDKNIVVSTIQSLVKNDRYKEKFHRNDFDLIITDEAHRSISGESNRELFKYFNSFKLGLTATPKSYLDNIDEKKLELHKPLELEERREKDTYAIFDCLEGPTFIFNLEMGSKAKILTQPKLVEMKSDKTNELLSEKGLIFKTYDDYGNETGEEVVRMKNFEKDFFSESTNEIICKHFLENAKLDPITGEIGKTLFFCVSQNHAEKLVRILNRLAREKFPKEYDSKYPFAKRITSNEDEPNKDTKLFTHSRNYLEGESTFKSETFKSYKTSKVRVCVTVGMMTTGYNCKDLLNVVMFRPIYSPSEFIQIKGRGTRLHNFVWRDDDGHIVKQVEKDNFYLMDYFGICNYFNKFHNFDKPPKVNIPSGVKGLSGGVIPKYGDKFSYDEDFIKESVWTTVNHSGLIVDKMGFKNGFESSNEAREFMKLFEDNEVEKAEDVFDSFLKKHGLDISRVAQFFNVKRKVDSDDIYNYFKTDNIINDNEYFNKKFEEFNSIFNFSGDELEDIRDFFYEYCFNPRTRGLIDRNELDKIDDHEFMVVAKKVMKKTYKEDIVNYIYEHNLYL